MNIASLSAHDNLAEVATGVLTMTVEKQDFIIHAIKESQYPQASDGHVGLRMNKLAEMFELAYNHKIEASFVNKLIADGKLIAVIIEWGRRKDRWNKTKSELRSAVVVSDVTNIENPMLYFPDNVPNMVRRKLEKTRRTQDRVHKILQRTRSTAST